MENVFDIDNFNIIEDEENYYFFRALNMADNQDLETGIILDKAGNFEKIRTDRERYEENPENGTPKYSKDAQMSLEQVYDHIKMHYRKDTNCISLSSNGNVSVSYGRGFYKDRYVMVKVPKKELGEKVINAGQYMLEEISKKVDEYISSISNDSKIIETINEIDNSKTEDEIKKAIETRYNSKEPLDPNKAKPRKGIKYKAPVTRISSYQALNEEQSLEKNKIIAKLTLLERVGGMEPIIPHTANNNLLVQTIGNAFSSLELIHYGDIEKDEIMDIPKEIIDIFALLQQVEGQDKQVIEDLKKEVIRFANEGKSIEIPENSTLLNEYSVRDNISIEEMYDLTDGKVEYGQANSIVKNMFYLAKSQSNAKELTKLLEQITENNPKYKGIIEYISNNGFRIEPEIITRLSNRGVKLSESVSLDLRNEQTELIDKIKELSEEEQIEIIENGGLSNIKNIMSSTFSKAQRNETITKEEYYAEAIFALYNWEKIGIEEFTTEERNNLIQRIQNEYCVELYQKLEEQGIDGKDIPTILLNIATRKNDFEIEENDTLETIKTKRLEQYDKIIAENIEFLKQEKSNGIISNLKQDLSIERIERFLGYYDIKGTGIQLRPYQQTADEKTDEILKDNRFASVILPTGGGKSFVTISQLLKHQKEEILYLAPQNEILEQMKDYIIKYVHGPVNTIGRSKDEIIADVFPNLKFSTYSGLLARNGKEIINKEYGFVVLDELHRTGAKEWGDRLNTLIDNQPETTKVLGITATPRRDADGINMANEMAERLGYTNKEAVSGKHIAMNMSLTNAIRMGLVVNPKLVSCAYSLKEDGSLDKLKDKIEQIEDIEEKNEKLAQYETLRRNIENAEGIPEILQANVKKGGKYIVFLPIVDELEDEDGNVIGRKKGKDKLADYEKQIAEYFKGSDIIPNFHSMLGEYGDKENAKRLEEFQNSNTEETEFMLVMNKANEGLHLDKLDGIIWLRPLDENSRILYLQQLGRVIYSEDPDNPTKDEDRPVVIDLVNNTIKVNWEDEITEQDDIQMLNLITNWAEAHNGILPNINSTDKEETGYAKILKEIQDKYKGYLENEFDGLNEKQIEEVREIIKLGTRIDLWQIELPEKIQQTRSDETNERSLTDRKIGSFEVTGLLKNFIELEKEIDESNNKSAIQKFIETLEKLKEIEVDVSKMVQKDTIGSLAKKSGINEEKIIKIGLNPEDSIGKSKTNIAANYRKDRDYVEKEQLKRLTELGIFLELRNPTQELIEILERMQKVGIEVSNITSKDTIGSLAKKSGISEEKIKEIGLSPRRNIGTRKNYIAIRYRKNSSYLDEEQLKRLDKLGIRLEKKKGPTQELIETLEKMKKTGIDVSKMVERDTIGSLAKKSGISKEKITEIGLNSKERIGVSKNSIAVKYRKNVKYITEEQLKKLEKLGINLEVQQRNIPQEFIETLEKMQEIGVDVSKMIQRDTIRSLAEKSGISEEKIKEIGLNPKENIGRKKHNISLKYKKDKKYVEKEQIKKLKSLGINLDKKTRTSKEIAEASISSLTDIEMSDREDVALKELVENTKEGGINLDEQS